MKCWSALHNDNTWDVAEKQTTTQSQEENDTKLEEPLFISRATELSTIYSISFCLLFFFIIYSSMETPAYSNILHIYGHGNVQEISITKKLTTF